MISAKRNINVLSLFIMMPSFWFFAVNDYLYYAVCLIVSIFIALNRPHIKVRMDPFLYWLLGFLVFVMILDLVNGAVSLGGTATLLYIFCILLYVVLVDINIDEIILASFLGMSTMFISSLIFGTEIGKHGNAAYLALVVLVLILARRYAMAVLLFALSFVMLTRAAILALVVVLLTWYVFRMYKRQSVLFRRSVLVALITGLIITPILIGHYLSDDPYFFILTSSRSYLYSLLWNEILTRGVDILIPISNVFATEYLSDNLLAGKFQGSVIKEVIAYYNQMAIQCTHSTYLEFLSNYGLIAFVTMFGLFSCIETRNTWPVVAFFIIAIGFNCVAFTPRFIVPIYILYRALYFAGDSGDRAGPNALCLKKG